MVSERLQPDAQAARRMIDRLVAEQTRDAGAWDDVHLGPVSREASSEE
jgi:hypothetical protein